jgi:hypothetical protein
MSRHDLSDANPAMADADPTPPETLRRYARAAGIAILLSVVCGALGESYIPGRIIVSGDAAATAANIVNQPTLFRLGFATYLVEGLSDISLCVFFYVLLKPVNKNLALLSAFFGLASMVLFATAQSTYYTASLILRDMGGMTSFSSEQRNALAYLGVRTSQTTATLFIMLYGIASMIRGYLIARSDYLPRLIGTLFMIGGAGFFLRSATYLLAPSLSTPLLLIPMAFAGIPLMLWLLIRGGAITHRFDASRGS